MMFVYVLISNLCATVVISVTKEGVKFSTKGDIGSANIVVRQNTSVDKVCSCFIYPFLFPLSLIFEG